VSCFTHYPFGRCEFSEADIDYAVVGGGGGVEGRRGRRKKCGVRSMGKGAERQQRSVLETEKRTRNREKFEEKEGKKKITDREQMEQKFGLKNFGG